MHSFTFFGGLLHATALLVVAFFVWFAAAKADGILKTLGRVLGAWLIVLAIAAVIVACLMPARHHMHGWEAPAAPAAAAANTAP